MFYEVFVTLPSNYFSLKSVGLFHPKFSRCATVFQPVDAYIIQSSQSLKSAESKFIQRLKDAMLVGFLSPVLSVRMTLFY